MNKPLVVIVGETASGKSKLAMKVAEDFDGEIISADSWAVYKKMNIGTAKPTAEDQAKIKHHLIDIVEPNEDYTAGLYKADAIKAMEQIHERGRLPIIVGGTGLYVDGVIYDFSFMKTGDKTMRQTYNSLSIAQLVKIIDEKGYDLTGVDTRNKRRLIRVIETEGASPSRSNLRNNTLIIGVSIERKKLRSNIVSRTEKMFRLGLKKEALAIAEEYGWDCEGMQGIGYKEFHKWHSGELSLNKVKQRIIRDTLALAKRQRTWFKRNKDIHWVANQTEAIELVKNFLSK